MFAGTEALGRELANKAAGAAVLQNVAGVSTNEAIVAFAQEKKASLVVVGPEASAVPLSHAPPHTHTHASSHAHTRTHHRTTHMHLRTRTRTRTHCGSR
jgi:hypothetical protein